MSDRSDDTRRKPEVSEGEDTGQVSEAPGDDDAGPPVETDPNLPGEAADSDTNGSSLTSSASTDAPSATEDSTAAGAAGTAAPDSSDGTPTRIAPLGDTTPQPDERSREGAAVAPADPAVSTGSAATADLASLADTDHTAVFAPLADRTALLDHPGGTAFLTARGLSAKGRQGPIFTGVSVTAHLGQILAVCGDGGDGRSSLLLALTGRFAHREGTLEVDGQTRPGQIRRRFTIAQAGPPIRLEPYATVGACIKETVTVSKGTATRANIHAWLDRLAVGVDTGDTFGFLPRIDQIRFTIACAAACRTPAVAVDDADTGLDTAGSERVFEALRTVADAGQLVIAACTRSDPPADTVVDLRDQHQTAVRMPHHLDRSTDRKLHSTRTRNGDRR